MDHTKLVIFLLIVLGTVATFGSPITKDSPKRYSERPEGHPGLSSDTKERDTLRSDPGMGIFHEIAPNRKQQKELSSSSEQDGKNVERGFPAIIAGAQLGADVIKSVLGALGDVNRKIAIGINNESGGKWTSINVYFDSGTSQSNIPDIVNSGQALLWGARKSGWSARGAVGVLTYFIPGIHKTLAVMYSVPYCYFWDDNWWNVKLYDNRVPASEKFYDQMYDDGNPFKGDNSWHSRFLGSGLHVRGAMSDSGEATLEIKVYQ